MLGITQLFAYASLVIALSGSNHDIIAMNNTGATLNNVYGYIASSLIDMPSSIDVTVNNFNSSDINTMIGSTGLQTYGANQDTNYDYAVYNLQSVKYITTDATTSDAASGAKKVKLFLTYKETKKETAYVYEKVAEIIKANKVQSLSPIEQYEWIYNYIIKNVEYDNTYNNITAYKALTEGKTICGGYSSLYYVFATELGLPCRIAYGTAYGIYHAWNLVQIDGTWYVVDATMGDGSKDGAAYFLKAMSSITTHNLDDAFETSVNLASSDYSVKYAMN